MNVYDFLIWLVAGGSAVAVSWVAERVTKFQTLDPNQKKWIQYGASVLIACAALAVQYYVPKEALEAIAPYFAIAAGLFGTFFVNQASHALDPARDRKS
jgi:hypothetical protein